MCLTSSPMHVHTCPGPEKKGRSCSQPSWPTVPPFTPTLQPRLARADFGGLNLEAIRGLDNVYPRSYFTGLAFLEGASRSPR